MPGLTRIAFTPEAESPGGPAAAFVEDAERRIRRFEKSDSAERVPAFFASDPRIVWNALVRIRDEALAPGRRFCEWGSGFGVVAGLAALAGYDSCGVEIDRGLVECSRGLLADHGISARIHRGSYVPPGAFTGETDAPALERELGFSPAAFDVVYAFPWPAEEELIARLFTAGAPEGSLLVTFYGGADLRLRRRE